MNHLISSQIIHLNWTKLNLASLYILQTLFFVILLSMVAESQVSTFILFQLVLFGGIWIIKSFLNKTNTNLTNQLTFLWIIKIFFSIIILTLYWVPELYPHLGRSGGFDPVRFYFYSKELIDNNWEPNFLNLNYTGIIYFYGFIFKLFGFNPYTPFLINSVITLFSSILLIKLVYKIKHLSASPIYLLLIIPEVLWYDVMTSRENLVASLIILFLFAHFYFLASVRSKYLWILLMLFSFFSIVLIRTSMILPLALYIFLSSVFLIKKRYFVSIFLTFSVFLFIAPMIQTQIGGYSFNYIQVFSTLINFENNIASQFEYSANSISYLIAPTNFLEAIVFIPVRMLFYILIPLPEFFSQFSISELFQGSSYQTTILLSSLTSLGLIACLPLIMLGTIFSWRNRQSNIQIFLIPIMTWCVFFSISAGNIILHDRYRLMCTLLLFTTALIGHSFIKYLPSRSYFLWGIILYLGAMSFVYIKL